jgi:hypothetical protein
VGAGYAFLVAIKKRVFSRSYMQEISSFRKKSTFSRKLTVLTILKKKKRKFFCLALSFGFCRKCCIGYQHFQRKASLSKTHRKRMEFSSVSDPWHFDADPDQWIRTVDNGSGSCSFHQWLSRNQ